MAFLTIFTPSYNRKHTIGRTYESLLRQTRKDFRWLVIDDGSTDGTREWVRTLGDLISPQNAAYDWMGRRMDRTTPDHFIVESNGLRIEYVGKENGGLYTGYNVAYDVIDTELCVCIDSDDYMPDDAVERIGRVWEEKGDDRYCGIEGLDFDINTGKPIGGYFPENLRECYLNDPSFKIVCTTNCDKSC